VFSVIAVLLVGQEPVADAVQEPGPERRRGFDEEQV
jgi:hypothetical protein